MTTHRSRVRLSFSQNEAEVLLAVLSAGAGDLDGALDGMPGGERRFRTYERASGRFHRALREAKERDAAREGS